MFQELESEKKMKKEKNTITESKSVYSNLSSFSKYLSSVGFGILTTIIATLTFQFISKESIFNIGTLLKNNFDITLVLIASILTAMLSIFILVLKMYDKKKKRI